MTQQETKIAIDEESVSRKLSREEFELLLKSFVPVNPKLDIEKVREKTTRTWNYILNTRVKIRIPYREGQDEVVNQALIICQRPERIMFTKESGVEVIHKDWLATVEASLAAFVLIGWIKEVHFTIPVCIVGYSPWHVKMYQEELGVFNVSPEDVNIAISDYKDTIIMRQEGEIGSLRRTVDGQSETIEKYSKGDTGLWAETRRRESGIMNYKEGNWLSNHWKLVAILFGALAAITLWVYILG